MKAVKKIINVIIDIVVVIILIFSLLILIMSLTSRSSGVPNIFGIAPITVISNSMEDKSNVESESQSAACAFSQIRGDDSG